MTINSCYSQLICTLLLVPAAFSLKLHDYGHEEEHHGYEDHGEHHQVESDHEEQGDHYHGEDTEHHHEIDHKHATSHQSIKFHHFHPVSVYIKKDPHPIEIGGTKSKLKLVHPETKHNHGHGLVLEHHVDSHRAHYEHEPEHHEHEHQEHDFPHYEHEQHGHGHYE